MNRKQKQRVYAGMAALVVVLFCAGIFAGYLSRNDKLCADGKPPLKQRSDAEIGRIVYLCHNGQMVTK